MEVFKVIGQFAEKGYPLWIFYLTVIIGFLFLVYRPYQAFLFSVFCLSARNFHAAVYTRTSMLGPYLNLNDLLLWIAVFAMLIEFFRTRKQIWSPKILLAIFVLILIGDFQSLFKYGIIEDVLRRIWSTAIFPLLFLVGVNMVKEGERAYLFYWALFLGAVIASLQHVIFVWGTTYHDVYIGIAQFRTISYIMSGGLFLVIGSIFTEPDKSLSNLKLIFYYLGLAMIALSYLLSLTRGIYILILITLIALPFLIREKVRFNKIAYRITLLTILIIFFVGILYPNFELSSILTKRIESFVYKETFSQAYETRLLGAKTELNLWLNTSLILGVGSSLPPDLVHFSSLDVFQTGALSHVGFTTYLVHFGVLGIIVYAILLPVSTIRIAKRYNFKHFMDYGGRVAVVAIVTALIDLIALPWSYHHIGATSHIPGLIYGAIWGLYRDEAIKRNLSPYDIYWVRQVRSIFV